MKKCIFKDMQHPISLYAASNSATPSWYEFDLKFPKKLEQIHLNACEARNSNVFNVFSNSGSSKTFRICGPTKIPSFNLAWLSLGNFLQRNLKPFEFCFAITLTKFFINPSLICNGGIKTLSGFTKGVCRIFFTPGAYEFLVSHSFVS